MKNCSLFRGAILILLIGCPQAALAQFEISREKQTAIEQVDALEHEIESMSLELWNYSEIALRETRSAAPRYSYDEPFNRLRSRFRSLTCALP